MGDRDYFRKDYMKEKSIFQPGFDNAIVSLIIFNLIVFTILLGLYLIYLVTFDTADVAKPAFYSQILDSLNLPADPAEFMYRPWTLVSYMFTHTHFSFFRLFANMLWLWSFGYIFQSIAGSTWVVPVYLYSGFIAGIVFIAAYPLFQTNLAPAMSGAAAPIIGLAVAATVMSPGYRLFPTLGSGIPLWVLTAIFLIIDLGTVSMSMNLLLAHAAAGLMGYVYVAMLKRGKDIGGWMNRFVNWCLELFEPEKKYQSKEKQTLYYKAVKQPFVKKPNLTQQKLDEILDKINQKGYDTLTEEEKEFLKKASEQL
jgi:membrane associated rhomboid family serine protease